jgi:hypothetical protein
MYAWRSIYWSEQVSSRTRALLMFDWIIRCVAQFHDLLLDLHFFVHRGIWGRDLSNF